MREMVELRYCQLLDIRADIKDDLGCENCDAYQRCLEEPNPFKCKELVFLKWFADEIRGDKK